MNRYLAALLSLVFVQISQAEVKTFKFTGTIDHLDNVHFFLNDSVEVGTEFEGYFDVADDVFEPTTSYTHYQYSEPDRSFMVRVGDYVFRSNPRDTGLDFAFENDGTNRYNQIDSQKLISSPRLLVDASSIWLREFSGTTWTNDEPATDGTPNSGMDLGGLANSFWMLGRVRSVVEITPDVPSHPVTANEEAVEIQWASQMGYFYQVQWSTNLATWENIGEPVLGDGTAITNFIPKPPGTVFYRSEIKNFDTQSSSPTNVLNRAFVGTITSVDDNDDIVNDSVDGGTPFKGFYTYDQDNLDLPITDPATGLTIQVGDYTFRSNPKHLDLYVYYQPDDSEFNISSYNNVSSPLLLLDTVEFTPTTIAVIGLDHGFRFEGVIEEVYENPEVITQRPTTAASPAVEVKWQSVMGYYYKIEASADQVAWQGLEEEPILGNGQVMSRFYRNSENWIYRAVLIPFDEL